MWKWFKRLLLLTLFFGFAGVAAIVGMYYYIKPELPDVKTITEVQLQTPMKVYSADGLLISQFGEKRRIPLAIEDIPQQMIDAFLATEDSRFYQHPGIDPIGIVRAATVYIASGHAKQGASTITQQVARNYFLTREKTLIRKIKEVFIALHIEQLLTKEEILALYLNKISLGYRSYGVGAAAQVYYGKSVAELTLAQTAVIAGLPKAPSKLNPIYSPENARSRRAVVLMRMLEEGYITRSEYDEANAEPITASYHGAEIELDAAFVAEMARQELVAMFGEDQAYNQGLNVYTTITKKPQLAANDALINNLINYDLRHGFRGPIEKLWDQSKGEAAWPMQKIFEHLAEQPFYNVLRPAVVTQVNEKEIEVLVQGGKAGTINWDGLKWARRFVNDKRQGPPPKRASDIVSAGDMVWVRTEEDELILSQLPDTSGALVALNPQDGAIQALVGGFDFKQSKFNRATMAKRQVGSNIKPFLYSAALENDYTLSTLVNDSPINHWDASLGKAWRPKNSPAVYDGPIRIRVALAKSKNVVSVRLIRSVGIGPVIEHLSKFGFHKEDLPPYETLALGAAELTPLEVATAYAIIANGGFKVSPYVIARIEDAYGNLIYQAAPDLACSSCGPEVAIEGGAEQQTLNEDQGLATFDEQILTLNETEGTANKSEKIDLTANSSEPYQAPTSKMAKRVISGANAFLIREALSSAIWGGTQNGEHWNGTGWRAGRALNRRDIAGKTGTTNESRDAWFSGMTPYSVATAWVGFDNHSRVLGYASYNANLGNQQVTGGEFGGRTAMPAWISYMATFLEDHPEQKKRVPQDIVTKTIDLETGLLSRSGGTNTRREYFEKGTEPTRYVPENQNDIFTNPDEESELF
ncbi:penicillin-binding protein 1A [Motilimonas cestriensis]|uniref:penicillin-binding protein 1A n=1 Tax=Motilimonas cestriensis TaxID=2742685 RepID=UPI003DA56826